MPHDKNGVELHVGDIVKGRGYNVKHEIIGRVVALKLGDTCNLEVEAIARPMPSVEGEVREARVVLDYGEANAFEKLS